MKKNRNINVLTIIAGILFLGEIILLSGCEDTLTSAIKEEVRIAELPEYTLTILDPVVGSVTPSGILKIKDGEPLDISASAPDGYSFVNWQKISGDGAVSFSDESASSTTLILTSGNATVQPVISSTIFNLTIGDDGNGTTNPASGIVQVADGVARIISATPNTGYEFDTWIQTSIVGGTASFDDPLSASTNVTVTGGDVTIEAKFKLLQHTMTVTVNDATKGSIVSPVSSSVLVVDDVAFNIEASDPTAPGYYFSGWEKTGGSGNVIFDSYTSQETTATVTGGDVTIRANFIIIDVHLEPLGYFNLNVLTETNYAKRMDDPRDFVYDNGYVYVVGSYGSTPKVMKINVSNPSNLTYTATENVSVGSNVTSVIVASSSYLHIAVPGFGIRSVYLPTFSESSYHSDTNVEMITQGWYATNSDVQQYYNTDSPVSPDANVTNIMYINEKDCLYVTGYDDMGDSGSITPVFGNYNNSMYAESGMTFTNIFLGEMAYTVQDSNVYVYASAGDDGLYTFFVDDPTEILTPNTQGTSPNTGSLVDMVTYGSYLITGGYKSGAKDSFSVYDIHLNNGSISNPYWLENFDSYSTTLDITAMDMYGNYLYVLEDTILRVYEFTAVTD